MGVPKYSFVQSALRRVFYKKDNTIHLFTEDKKEDQVFYDLLFRRLESDNLKIGSISPLGSRANVMKKSLQDKSPTVPTLYIIDGDIDLLSNDPIDNGNLIGLDRYCIENYLICEEGLLSLLYTNFGGTLDNHRSRLEFRNTLNKFCQSFLKIAFRYTVAQDLGCSVGYKKAFDFIEERNGGIIILNSQKVKDEIIRVEIMIQKQLKKNKIRAYNKEMKRLLSQIESRNSFSIDNYLRVISGKDFLFPLVEKKIKKVERKLTNWSTDQLKRNLAERIDISSLSRLKDKIVRTL